MKNFMIVLLVLLTSSVFAQKVGVESLIIADTNNLQVPFQRLALSTDFLLLKYDYNKFNSDVLSLTAPKIFADSVKSFGASLIKVDSKLSDGVFVIDVFGKLKIGNISASFDAGRILKPQQNPNDFLGFRLSYDDFTAEAYVLTTNPLVKGISSKDYFYGWAAYHPEKMFLSAGISDEQYWFFGGTRNLKNFGNFLFANYNPQNGNFWFRNQSGFGDIDTKFFSKDLYIFAINYLILPVFHTQRFSPIATKGSYSFKVDGRRINNVHYYELAMGKKIANDLFQMAVGINSEYKENLRVAPTLELYKNFQIDDMTGIIELRYDFLSQSLNTYLIFRY